MQAQTLKGFRLSQRFLLASICALLISFSGLPMHAQTTAPPKTAPVVGTVQSISGNILTLKTDSGAELKVQLPSEVKVLRVPPGSKDLKEATPIQLSDLLPGDRVLVRGKQGDDASSFVAATIVAMKKSDIAVKQEKDREEWQRHGIGGLVNSVDPAQNSITIKTLTAAGSKDVVIHASQSTILRRYAPGSVNFDEAKVAPIAEIKPGDQLRARGTRSGDGGEFNADEIVSGSFRNIAGIVVGDERFCRHADAERSGDKEASGTEGHCGISDAKVAAAHGPAHCRTVERRCGYERRYSSRRPTGRHAHTRGRTGEQQRRWWHGRPSAKRERRSAANAEPASRKSAH